MKAMQITAVAAVGIGVFLLLLKYQKGVEQSLMREVQYQPLWSDNITGNRAGDKGIIYV